jgi:negative regulator of flagellin synthesis FlgM
MEISGKNPLITPNAGVSRLDAAHQQNARPQKSAEEGARLGTDRIELSVRSREIQHLDELIQSTPDVREGRVEQVRRELESGTYNVKAERIADKILGGNLIDEIF